MQIEHLFFGIVYILCGLAFIFVSIPLVQRKIPMNRRYGFRFTKSFASDDNWYRINAYGGRQLIRWSVVLIITGVATLLIRVPGISDGAPRLLLTLLPILLCTAIPIALTLRYASRLP